MCRGLWPSSLWECRGSIEQNLVVCNMESKFLLNPIYRDSILVGASSVHAVRGLICTRGQGTRLYTRNGFAVGNVCKSKVCYHPQPTHPPTQPKGMCVCAYSWEDMQVQGMLPSPAHPPTHPTKVCVCVCVQLGMYASPRYVTIPTPPTHPTQRYVCVCVRTVGNVCKSKVCYHPHPTHPPTQPKGMCVCVCVQLGMYASPRYVTIPTPPTHPPNPKVCVCVCAYSWECMQVQGMLPSPPHPPTHPTQRYVCVCVRTVGNVCKSKVCYHPQPTHPPNPKVCVCVCVRTVGNVCKSKVCYHPHPTHPPPTQPKGMCVQMSPQKHVVCTDESDLCAQMRLLECVYRWVKSVCADESPTSILGANKPLWDVTM